MEQIEDWSEEGACTEHRRKINEVWLSLNEMSRDEKKNENMEDYVIKTQQ